MLKIKNHGAKVIVNGLQKLKSSLFIHLLCELPFYMSDSYFSLPMIVAVPFAFSLSIKTPSASLAYIFISIFPIIRLLGII